jgi:hypothetical protein
MKNRRTAKYYVVDGKVMSPGDLRRLHRYLIEVEASRSYPRPWLCRRRPGRLDRPAAAGGK